MTTIKLTPDDLAKLRNGEIIERIGGPTIRLVCSSQKSKRTFDYVCFSCAEKATGGLEPSNGGAFTVHVGKCDKCKKKKPLGHIRDFGLDKYLVFRDLSPLD